MEYNHFRHLQEQGRTEPHLHLIESHVLDIPNRIRETFKDNNWFTCWNPETLRYEIHYDGKAFTTIEVDVPFDELDQRILDTLEKNRAYKAKEIIAEMIRKNEKRELSASAKANEYAKDVLSDVYDYNDNHPTKKVKHSEITQAMEGSV